MRISFCGTVRSGHYFLKRWSVQQTNCPLVWTSRNASNYAYTRAIRIANYRSESQECSMFRVAKRTHKTRDYIYTCVCVRVCVCVCVCAWVNMLIFLVDIVRINDVPCLLCLCCLISETAFFALAQILHCAAHARIHRPTVLPCSTAGRRTDGYRCSQFADNKVRPTDL